jgi:hypothetical protein
VEEQLSCVNLDIDYFNVKNVYIRKISSDTGIKKNILKGIFRGTINPTDEQRFTIYEYVNVVRERYNKQHVVEN